MKGAHGGMVWEGWRMGSYNIAAEELGRHNSRMIEAIIAEIPDACRVRVSLIQ